MNSGFWKDRRVLLTGHTGFKGAWLALWLQQMGARVTGFALAPTTEPSAFELFNLRDSVDSEIGDVRDERAVAAVVDRARPQIVFHLASQALVRESIRNPARTFATNVLGIVNVLEALRRCKEPVVLVNVTSDKVYENTAGSHPYAETDRLGGTDPYSASKACAELVTAAYRSSVLGASNARVSSARAGNVIGGGDWAADRLVPDIVRSVVASQDVILRYPTATRPWQHVLEPLSGYLTLGQQMIERGAQIDGAYNFGPTAGSAIPPVAELADRILGALDSERKWRKAETYEPPEMQQLQIDSMKAGTVLGWRPRLSISEAIEWTALWYDAWRRSADVRAFSLEQIEAYQERLSLV